MIDSFTRRRFLAAGTATAVSSALPAWSAAPKHPLGVQLYMVSKELAADPNGTLKQLRSIGYQHVESFSLPGMTAAAFRKALDDADLKCHSSHLMFKDEDWGPLFADANALGAKYAVSSVLLPMTEKMGMSEMIAKLSTLTLDDFKKTADLANRIGQKAKEAGLQYAYHNHNFEFKDYGGQTGYDLLLKQTDPQLVKLELDCGWMTVGGYDPITYFAKYPERYRLMHAKDFVAIKPASNSVKPGERPAITEVGSGMVQWKPIVAAAKAAGVEFYYVDHDPPFVGKTALEAAKVDYQYLQPLLG